MKRGTALFLIALLLLAFLPAAAAIAIDHVMVYNVPSGVGRVVAYFTDSSNVDCIETGDIWIGNVSGLNSDLFAGVILVWDTQQQLTIERGSNLIELTTADASLIVNIEGSPTPRTLFKGAVWFQKVDDDDDGLNGATFLLYRQLGASPQVEFDTRIGEFTTAPLAGEDGVIFITNMDIGSYYFVEVAAPTGFVISVGYHEFNVTVDDEGNPVTTVVTAANAFDRTFYNGGIHLTVYGNNQTRLAGATYTLFRQEGAEIDATLDSIVGIYTSAEFNGQQGVICVTGLSEGIYYFVETDLPARYIDSDTYYVFEVEEATEGSVTMRYMSLFNTTSDAPDPDGGIPLWVAIVGGIVILGLIALVVWLAIRSRRI